MRFLRMVMRTFKDAFKNIFRQGWLSFSAIISITVTLFLTSVLLIISLNISESTQNISQELSAIVLLEKSVTEQDALAMKQDIEKWSNVIDVKYSSEEQEYAELLEAFDDETKELLNKYKDTNPLHKVLVIKMNDPKLEPKLKEDILKKYEDKIYEYDYNTEVASAILPIFEGIRNGAFILILSVAFVAIILISNTIRITIIARRSEIGIMRLVAASNWYIRTPFILEGVILGAIGGFLAATFSLGLYQHFMPNIQNELAFASAGNLLSFYAVADEVVVWSLSLGVVIGLVGSFFPVRKYLKK